MCKQKTMREIYIHPAKWAVIKGLVCNLFAIQFGEIKAKNYDDNDECVLFRLVVFIYR